MKKDYTCSRCARTMRERDQRGDWCRWCAWQIDVDLAVIVHDRDAFDQAFLDHRSVSVVNLAALGGWDAEKDMLKGAFGG